MVSVDDLLLLFIELYGVFFGFWVRPLCRYLQGCLTTLMRPLTMCMLLLPLSLAMVGAVYAPSKSSLKRRLGNAATATPPPPPPGRLVYVTKDASNE